ncbi:MAG: hypothetical protein M3R14_11970 [Acidobacteriota bacterium]|nr:hypothetical protein [Acidobacteriota bacterium]
MKLFSLFRVLLVSFILATVSIVSAQELNESAIEILTNTDVVLMSKTNLSKTLIINKIKDSKGAFDISVQGLVNLKNAGVDEEIIETMLEKGRLLREKISVGTATTGFSDSQTVLKSVPPIVQSPADAVHSAKTIAIEKSSLNPSRQALEKELLKRMDWQKLNLNIVRFKEAADLRIEVGRVPLSLVTHRYVFRIYDNRSGTVIVAGETTSWGSLAKNLARHISIKLGSAAK